VDKLTDNLAAIVGRDYVLSKPDELLVYECDGLPHHKHRPRAVVFPSSTEETSAVMRELARANVAFTPRGAGTGLSGGALALNSGVVVELARMRKILRIDADNQIAVVQPGVVNLNVSKAVAKYGLYYVPDPSSQPTCTIGGNIAESAGGIHCLKYGTTTDHVLGCRVVLSGGEIIDLGSAGTEVHGYDLLGTFIGSEGTFGIATEATLRLLQSPPAIRTLLAEFAEVNDASHAVSAIIAAGVMPAALEMMDREIIRAVEASIFAAGLPPDAGAALLIELDGIEAGIDDEAERVTSICMEYGARNCRRARDEAERKKLWAARKGAFGAIGRISPDSMIQDAVVPRSRLPEVLGAAYEIAGKYNLKIANVFHAGDGNLHPLICFDSRFAEEVRRVKEAGRELMEVCVAAGGTITGEHGVGLDKQELLPLVFSDADMNAMLRVRAAFDPLGLCNPGKIVPMLRGCGEGNAISQPSSTTNAASIVSAPAKLPETTSTKKQSISIDDIARRVGQIVGEENLVTETPAIAFPASLKEAIELVKLAASEGWTVTPAGGRSWLNSQANLVVSTARINKIIEHEPADLIAIAEAGVKLDDFNEVLGQNGQWLPLDPPNDGRATLGGVVATGLGGAQQFSYGRPRGTVIGMKVVLADGTVVKAGGRVVKNVAGYDLCKLFTGSYGNLGLIAEINFKLRPRPAQESTLVVTGNTNQLLKAGRKVLQARLFPVALELLSSALADQIGIKTDEGLPVLLVRFAGNEKGVSVQARQARNILGEELPQSRTQLISDDFEVWRLLAAAPLIDDSDLICRASVLPNSLGTFFETITKLVAGGEGSRWQMGVGDGRIRMFTNPGSVEQMGGIISQLKETAESSGGTFFVEKSSNKIGIEYSRSALAERVKQQLDPNHTFA